MQTKKMSLASIQGKLSRTEMKNIMAGSGNKCNVACTANSDCDSTCPSCEKVAWADQKFCFIL